MKVYISPFIQFLVKKYELNLDQELADFRQLHRYEFLNQKEKIEFVLSQISEVSSITPEQIKSRSRVREIIDWRHIARYVCYVNNYGTLRFIGLETGGHDHSTVIHSVEKVRDLIAVKDKGFMDKINAINHLIHEEKTININ